MTWCQLAGWPREDMAESGGNSAERAFVVPYADRFTAAASLIATAKPGLGHTRVVGISIQPLSSELAPGGTITTPATQEVTYSLAVIRVQYGTVFASKTWPTDVDKPSIRSGTELRLRMRGSGQFLTLPGRSVEWGDADDEMWGEAETAPPVTEDSHNHTLINLSEFGLVWDYVDDPPINRFRDLMGTVNDDEFLGQPAGTLLFETYDIDDSFKVNITNPHTNRANVMIRQRLVATEEVDMATVYYGWNHEYRDAPPGWVEVLKTDGNPRYAEADWSGMFA